VRQSGDPVRPPAGPLRADARPPRLHAATQPGADGDDPGGDPPAKPCAAPLDA
jgi:hypothetical protein